MASIELTRVRGAVGIRIAVPEGGTRVASGRLAARATVARSLQTGSGYICFMPPTESQQQAWMAQWRRAADALAKVRQAEVEAADLPLIAAQLEDACLASLRSKPPGPTSGLVIQQRIFGLARRG